MSQLLMVHELLMTDSIARAEKISARSSHQVSNVRDCSPLILIFGPFSGPNYDRYRDPNHKGYFGVLIQDFNAFATLPH
jgi:hypothetical protein